MTRYDMSCFSCANVIEKDGVKYCAPFMRTGVFPYRLDGTKAAEYRFWCPEEIRPQLTLIPEEEEK